MSAEPKVVLSQRFLISAFLVFIALSLVYIGSVSGIFSSYLGSTYFSMMSPDSYRYYEEVQLFSGKTIFVNEFSGEFEGYKTTPKFGLPALLSVFNPLALDFSYQFYYSVSCLLIFFCALINLNLLEKSISGYKLSTLAYFLVFFAVILFPTDVYWVARFLREGLANSFFVMSMLATYCYFRFGSKYIPVLAASLLFLFFLRPQLILLTLVFVLLCFHAFRKLDMRIFFLMTLLVSAAVFQIIQASGLAFFATILGIFGLESLVRFLAGFNYAFFGQAVLWFVISFSVVFGTFRKSNLQNNIPRFSMLLIGGLVLFLAVVIALLGMQIRFVYPIFILIKFILLMWFIQQYKPVSDQKYPPISTL
ncbi:hypothetical protein [Aliidiomarina soli]|uniref:Uncharacterized protein n=1 Tax=Aliidiomarina soli TaxID=1928574 RepID=A0A432WD55_9GAMM|nr:hypothetical protein [Aliidiomarina soli]RUO30336.1 hypothetical protein CWE14_13280 [Aliidiomarina soli]